MESEQKPKEIKIEFSCEVKELPPTKKQKKRKERALWVSFYLGCAAFFLLCDSIYFFATTEQWTDARTYFVAGLMALSILLFYISAVVNSYYDTPNYKDIKNSDSYFNDYDYL